MEPVNPELLGTHQHNKSRDLSRYLVHLTRSESDLISILLSGRIEARTPFGAGKDFNIAVERHKSVCFTEMPLSELNRMFDQGRKWGIAFDKERLHRELGAQPVWCLGQGTAQLKAVNVAMKMAEGDALAPIWTLTPFIENVRPRYSRYPNDWRWEREWRVQGDIEFDANDVALIIIDEEGTPSVLDRVDIGLPWMAPGDVEATWSGGYTRSWDEAIQEMLERFHDQFAMPSEVGSWDKEDSVFYGPGELVETEYAMDEAFGHLMPALHAAIYAELASQSDEWCRRYDEYHDDDYII